jgi:hypothetical protein
MGQRRSRACRPRWHRKPQIIERLLSTVDSTVGTVGGIANTALQPGGVVSQTVGTGGRWPTPPCSPAAS